jgi:hypothetical protein
VKLVPVILIAFPSNVERNSRKMEREKQEIEPDKEKPEVLDCFEINCICSSFGEPELGMFLQNGGE